AGDARAHPLRNRQYSRDSLRTAVIVVLPAVRRRAPTERGRSARAALRAGRCAAAARPRWRECEGVEPSRRREGAIATVLKTARPTGTHPLPDRSYRVARA